MLSYQMLPAPEMERWTGIGKTTMYELLNPESDKYDPTFPKPVVLSRRCVRWRSDEVQAWLDAKSDSRDSGRIERHAQAAKAAKAGVAKRKASAIELAGQA